MSSACLETGTVRHSPAHRVVKDLFASGVCQCLVLHVETLVLGRDTGVTDAHWECSMIRFSELMESRMVQDHHTRMVYENDGRNG